MNFGAFLQKLRKEKGIKQRDFAAQVGLSRSYLCQIEHNDKPAPQEHIVQRIAQVLGADEATMIKLARESHPPKQKRVVTEEARRKQSLSRMGYIPTEATRLKLKMANLGRKDSEATRAKKQVILEQARQRRAEMLRLKRAYTECGFCGVPGPDQEKSVIRYVDEQKDFALCPRCFKQWQQKPDDAVVIPVGRQEQSA